MKLQIDADLTIGIDLFAGQGLYGYIGWFHGERQLAKSRDIEERVKFFYQLPRVDESNRMRMYLLENSQQ